MQKNTTPLPAQEKQIRVRPGMPMDDPIDIQKLALALLQRWWAIVLCMLLGVGWGWWHTTYRTAPTYSTSSLIYVNASRVTLGSTKISVSDFGSSVQLGDRYTVAITSRRVLEKAITENDLKYSYGQLKSMVSVHSVEDTEFLSVTVRCGDPVDCANVCNAVTNALIDVMNALVDGNNVRILDTAQVPTSGTGESLRSNVLKGGAVGAVACCGLLTLLYMLDNTVKDKDDLLSKYRYPLLATIPNHASAPTGSYSTKQSKHKHHHSKKSQVFCGWDSISFAGREAYNLLRTNVEYSFPREAGEKRGRVVGITSSVPNEFKSTTSVNLVLSLAEEGKKVLLLDCDLRKTDLENSLQLPSESKGVSDYLIGTTGLEESIHYNVMRDGMDVLLGGTFPPNPSELLASDRMQEMIDILRKQYDFIIVDLPPLMEVPDALVAGRFCDGMLTVIREHFTTVKDLEQSIRELEYTKIRILGLILTGDTSHAGRTKYYKYGYKYGYGYGYGYSNQKKKK